MNRLPTKTVLRNSLIGVLAGVQSVACGQDLSGYWQGVEFNPGSAIATYWPSLLTLKQTPTRLEATLVQLAGTNHACTVRFQLTGHRQGPGLVLRHQRILTTRSCGNNWCLGVMTLRYDSVAGKLYGPTAYPQASCNGRIELYRIRPVAQPVICPNRRVTLRVTGQQVRWYRDAGKTSLMHAGNQLSCVISRATTFYLSQTQYGQESPLVPIRFDPATITIDQVTTSPATGPPANGAIAVRHVTTSTPGRVRFSLNGSHFQPSPRFARLAAGDYVLTARNAQGCLTQYPVAVARQQVGGGLASTAMVTPAPVVAATRPDSIALPVRGESVVLRQVLFGQSTATLLPASYPELASLTRLMQAKTTLTIRLEGHTDRIGEAADNLKLSQERALSVKRYLLNQGIDAGRITVAGYGDTRILCAPPCAANRRVAFVVVDP